MFNVYLSSSNENGSIRFPYWKEKSETSESRWIFILSNVESWTAKWEIKFISPKNQKQKAEYIFKKGKKPKELAA